MSTDSRSKARNTRGRQLVRTALASCPDFVTAQQLHQLLTAQGASIGLATVYRNLQSLVADGEADTLRSETGEMAYRCCSARHHHHLICRACGKTVEIASPLVEEWTESIAHEYGFSHPAHDLEITGVCAECTPLAQP